MVCDHVHSQSLEAQRVTLTGTPSAQRLACPANEVSEVEHMVGLLDILLNERNQEAKVSQQKVPKPRSITRAAQQEARSD